MLKEFYSESQQQRLRVRDIIKFGRVNFKITEIKSDYIDREFTGTCHSTNLSTMLFEKKGKKANIGPGLIKKADSIGSNQSRNHQVGQSATANVNRPEDEYGINENDISGINNHTDMNLVTDNNTT